MAGSINANGIMSFGNDLGGSVTIVPKSDTTTNYTVTIPDTTGTLSTQEWANSQDIGVGQTLQNVTSSRVINTTYTNSTGKPILLMLYGVTNTSRYVTINGTKFQWCGGVVTASTLVSFIIQNGATYNVSSFDYWFEQR